MTAWRLAQFLAALAVDLTVWAAETVIDKVRDRTGDFGRWERERGR